MYKIAVIYSTYPELEKIAREFTIKKGYHVEVANCVLDRAVEVAKEYEARGFDIIISRGATGAMIDKAVKTPVVNIEITNFDIIKALNEAKKLGRKIALYLFDRDLRYNDLDFIREVLNISKEDFEIYYFENVSELREKVSKAYYNGMEVVVGIGAYTIEIGKSYDMKTIMVNSQSEAIYNAFIQAENMIDVVYKLRKVNRFFDVLTQEEILGLIFLDDNREIKYMSDNICTYLKINPSLFIGRKVDEAFKDIPLFKPLLTEKKNYISYCKGSDLSVKEIALQSGGEILGYAIKIQYATYGDDVLSTKELEANNARSYANKSGLKARYTFDDYIGNSEVVVNLINKAKSYSKTDANILISGESGTGKEVIANGIHNESPRRDGPFVAVNCAALPQSLLESELFGYEEGAFTGAKKGGKVGIFELAQGGTVFLDEISEITLAAQAQLLRVIQERVIIRVGGNKPIPVDVRIIAATNANLPDRIRQGQFREDLYHRLNVLNLQIPSLRNRKEDIPVLINHFIKRHLGNRSIELPSIFMRKLQNYQWHGNVRELENFVEKFIILSQDTKDYFKLLEELYFDLINSDMQTVNDTEDKISINIGTLKDMELEIIDVLAKKYSDDKVTLARKLGISRTSLWTKLKEIDKINSF
ncbi:sigma 54-interacting transcriptional regulator [Lutispora sp.]|uniref:sigma 54-interacting transcriptional regulator n=1 Tax=Lutispora sp. TaxID=2828727 RepID=UPI003563D99F